MNDSNRAADLGRFLTLADVAAELKITVQETWELVNTGELPAIRVGTRKHWRIEAAALEAYIEGKYEESRRMGLWNQAEFGNIAELAFGEPRQQ